jgi:hypothetical protein
MLVTAMLVILIIIVAWYLFYTFVFRESMRLSERLTFALAVVGAALGGVISRLAPGPIHSHDMTVFIGGAIGASVLILSGGLLKAYLEWRRRL